MAGWGFRGGPVPRGGPHGAGRRRPWRLLLLAWLSLGCGLGTAQVRGPSPGDAGAGPRAPRPCSAPPAVGPGCLGALGTLELLLQLLRGRRRPPRPEVPAVCRGGAVHGRPAAVPALPAPGLPRRLRALPCHAVLPLRQQARTGHAGPVPLGALPRSPQRLRPQLPGQGAQLLLHLRPGAGRHPLQPRLPRPLRRRALPERGLRWDPGLGHAARRLRPVRRRPRHVSLRAPALPGRGPLLRLFWVRERDQDPSWGHPHQGDGQEPQLPRPDDERWALRAQRGLVHRLAGAVRGGRYPAALCPGPRRHREPGGARAHRRGSARDGPAAGAQPWHRVRVLAAPRASPTWPWRHQPPAAAPDPGSRQTPAPGAPGHPGPHAAAPSWALCHGATTEKPPRRELGQGCCRAMREVPPGQGTLPARPALLPERLCLPGQDPGAALGGAGDALRGGGENAISSPLPPGDPGVRVGAQHLQLPPAPGGQRVSAHGAAARQLRAHTQPHPAAGRRLRPAVDAPRGPAGAGGSPALPPAPAALSPPGSITRGGDGRRDPKGEPGGWKRSCPSHGCGGARAPRDPRPALRPVTGISPSLGSTWLRGGGGGW